jgi:GT2 family glycosyltransferase/glycosyltransferase involved in cell wall biosynthesis
MPDGPSANEPIRDEGGEADAGGSTDEERLARLAADIERLEAAVRDRSAALVEAREMSRQSRLTAEALQRELDRALKDRDSALAKVERVKAHPVVRAGLASIRAARAARRAVVDLRPSGGASRGAERRLTRRILAQLPAPPPIHGPRVTIVILTRDGIGHLRKLLPQLDTIAYRDVEIVIVDNASSDDSVELIRRHESRHPIRIVENAENVSFSEANNEVVGECDTELVLLLNNDIVPMEPNWLGWMVQSVMTQGTVACGARLVLPRRRHRASDPPGQQADLDLQHAGIHFEWIEGMPHPRNIGGPDPCAAGLVEVRERPAATAACLLVRRADFLAVGGFDPAYTYGHEDVDLCLRLRARGGRIVVDGRAVLWHDESATRRLDGNATVRRQRQNREVFFARWGSRLFREVWLDWLDGGRFLTNASPSCAIVVAGGRDVAPADSSLASLRAALAAGGWTSTLIVGDGDDWRAVADAVIVADPGIDIRRLQRGIIKIGWIVGSAEAWVDTPWIDAYDILLAEDGTARETVRAGTSLVARAPSAEQSGPDGIARWIQAELRRWIASRRFGILIQADDWDRAPTSGDYHFARALQRQFERRDLPASVYFRPDWTAPPSTRDDVAIHLWGRYPVRRRPGQTNVLWILYHPELVTKELLSKYDLVLVASDSFAATIARQTAVPVVALHQATDPERFRPGGSGPPHDLLFVGNSRGVRRPILDDITPTPHDLAVYGGGWPPDLIDPAYLRGSSVPNEDLPGYYASAAIVLNDHWREQAEGGFLNNRLYDALAAGGFVISDAVEGLAAEFDDGVVAYRDAADLLELVERYLADPVARAARAERGRRAVLERHTFAHRTEAILELLDALEPPRPAEIAAPAPVPAASAGDGDGSM